MPNKKKASLYISERFKSVIDSLNIPRKVIAERMGLDNADQLSSLVNGRVRVTRLHTKVLKAEFDVNCDWIFDPKETPPTTSDHKLRNKSGEISTEQLTTEKTSSFQEKRELNDAKKEFDEAKRLRFKNQCGSYLFDEFFDFIAEYYGEDKVGVDAFFLNLYESHGNFRTWVDEKKARDDSQNKGLDNISADLKK